MTAQPANREAGDPPTDGTTPMSKAVGRCTAAAGIDDDVVLTP